MYDWKRLMTQFNDIIFARKEKRRLTPEARAAKWAGMPPATADQIAATEARLGITLPESYKSFLRFSNGWEYINTIIYRLNPIDQVDWFYVLDPEYVEIIEDWPDTPVSDEEYAQYHWWRNAGYFRKEYVRSFLLIANTGDAANVVLNTAYSNDGEWEAIRITSWGEAITRYRNFWAFMEDQYVLLEMMPAILLDDEEDSAD